MKILLIKPPLNSKLITTTRYEPLGLEYIAAAVSDHEVEIFDMRLDKKLIDKLWKFKPNVVGVTSYTCDVNTVNNLLKMIKQHNPSITTVVGGNHATFMPESFAHNFTDIIVMGYGDVLFKQIIDTLDNGGSLTQIPNIGIVKNEQIHFTERIEHCVNLNELPIPARHLTQKYHKKYHDSIMNKVSLVLTSRGCPFRCTFCACWKLMDGHYKVRDNQSIINELKALPKTTQAVYFADDNTLHNVTRAWELGNMIRQNNINKKFQMYARVDTIVKHPKLLENLREAGLSYLTVGLESISDGMLKELNKSSTVAKNNEAIRILKKLGIGVNAHFLINPQFTIKDFDDLYKYVCDKHLYRTAYPVLTPLPGTELYEEVYDQMVIKDHDYVDFCHALVPTHLKRSEFYNQVARLYGRSYSPLRMVQYYKHKFLKSRQSPDFFAYHSDGMGFLKFLFVQLLGYTSFLKMKNAYKDEHPLLKPINLETKPVEIKLAVAKGVG